MAKEFITNQEISDVMIERPLSFSIKGRHYSIFPASLGKIQLVTRLLEAAGLSNLSDSSLLYPSFLEAAKNSRNELLRILAYSTLEGNECLDENKVEKRIRQLSKIDDVNLASLVIASLSLDKSELIIKRFAIDVEENQLQKIAKIKSSSKNSFSFGCRSVWGALIDSACERYGWSYQYVLWGISYGALRIMLSDQSRSVFLSDEERKMIHLPNDRNIVRAEDSDMLNTIIKTQSWK